VHRLENTIQETKSQEISLVYYNLGITGPNLRGCGVKHDLRVEDTYEIYEEIDWDICTREAGPGYSDCFSRYT